MGDAAVSLPPTVSATEPRRWIAAIVGGVLLGEALWSMLQLLIRDWATPALLNAMGQGPTQNPAAFEPLPLVIAFIEACIAAIVLVLLMSWAQRRTRIVVRTVVASSVPATPVVERRSEPRPSVAPTPVATASKVEVAPKPIGTAPIPAVAAPRAAMVAPTASVPNTASPRPVMPQAASAQAMAQPAASSQVAPVPAAPVKPAPPPAPKKPKVVYYNSVGEPIEE
jgi:hypothetical protein